MCIKFKIKHETKWKKNNIKIHTEKFILKRTERKEEKKMFNKLF